MQFSTLTSLVVASAAISQAAALPTVQENSLIPLSDTLKTSHPEAYAAFMSAPFINLDSTNEKRQEVPVDGQPNSTRPIVTPKNIFVLQCSDAGFRGDCLSWGAPPGRCVNYSSFNKTQEFLNQYDNQTSSLSTNTGGLCQFYKFADCNNKGDDRGVTLSYNYNLGEATDDYSGDYDDQISSSALFTAATIIVPSVQAVDTLVDVGYAKFQGAVTNADLGVTTWKGIQFGAPPVGDLRFAAPADPVQTGTVNATAHGPICPPQQPTDWTVTGTYERFTVAEDCLYLAVTAPSDASVDSKLPVVFFIQGGGFGSNSNANWDASEIASEGVIVVQTNYRVGMYGFLQSEEVRAGGSLNAGIKDMIKALEWVQTNIAKFGGNPEQVVLDGVSAGGSAVGLLMAANTGGKKLFAGGIAESGGWVTMRTMEQGQGQFDCLVKEKNCTGSADSLACLRALNESEVRSSSCWFNPGIDGELFTDSMVNLFEAGNYTKVPTIWGSCANEGTKYSAPQSTNSTEEANTWLLGQDPSLSNSSLAVLDDLYIDVPQPVFPESGIKWRQAANAIADIGTHCIVRNIQNYLARDEVTTYNYRYGVLDPKDEADGFGAYHTVNTYAFWGPNRTDGSAPSSYFNTNAPVVSQFRKYWVSFIRNLDPNTDREKGAAEWRAFTGPEGRERLFVQTNNTRMEKMSSAQALRCDVVRPMSNNLGKPVDSGVVTELDAALAAGLNGTTEDTTFGKKRHARQFSRYF
ncbi:carboxylesterase [Colletotrichum karsti]|uniref:Carboxylesterase n=1 Tax=Colletotrichum karsti TaxID=1095194 RepID=A0A9P6IF11_9PEZI|nr:carboxylesterase [Colletotrichum karsti]KAF9877480.1 carboxylesterase [Colletotrichum karsti]